MEARRWRITMVALVLGSMVLPTSGVALAPVALAHHQEGHDAQSEQATERSSAPDQQGKEKPSPTESASETVEEPATVEEATTTTITGITRSPEPQADQPVSSPSTTLAMTDENEAAFRPPSQSSLTQSTDDAEEQSAPAATPAGQFVQEHSSRILAAFAVSLENILPPAIAEIILSPLLILDMVIRVLVESGRAIAMPFVLLLVYVLWGEILRPLRFAAPTVSIRRKRDRPREVVRPAFGLYSPPRTERPVRDRPPGRPKVIEATRRPEHPPRMASVPRSPQAPPWGSPADHPWRSPRGATVGRTAHRPTPAPPTPA
jgi:hypothetical protein